MAENRYFENIGLLSGEYAGAEFQDSQSTLVTVTLADIPFTKEADQKVWFNGDLTLKFTIDNTVGEGPLDSITVNDTLDKTKFLYIPGSVIVQLNDGTTTETLTLGTDYNVIYTPNTPDNTKDLLSIVFLDGGAAESIPVGSIVTITFRGSKVAA